MTGLLLALALAQAPLRLGPGGVACPAGYAVQVVTGNRGSGRCVAVGGSVTGPSGLVGATGTPSSSTYLRGDWTWSAAAGTAGPPGPSGPAGAKGDTGATGPSGPIGPKGDTGLTGPTGPSGPQGAPGTNGADGAQGIQGIQGPTGPTGPQGNPGVNSWAAIPDKPSTFAAIVPVATASALAATPTLCSGVTVAQGVLANGNATSCITPAGTYSLPAAGVATLGGVKGTGTVLACSAGQHAMGFDAAGTLQCGSDPATPALPLAIANGGTANGSLTVTAGNALVADGTKVISVATGTCTSSAATTCTITGQRSGCRPVCAMGSSASTWVRGTISTTTITCTFSTSGTNTCNCICF